MLSLAVHAAVGSAASLCRERGARYDDTRRPLTYVLDAWLKLAQHRWWPSPPELQSFCLRQPAGVLLVDCALKWDTAMKVPKKDVLYY